MMTLLLACAVQNGFSKKEYTKIYEKTFSLSEGGKVSLENIHGHVDVNTWDRNHVQIKVIVRVNASSQDNAEDDLERIDIDFASSAAFVSARTSIDSKKKSFWWFIQSWWDDSDVEVDYEVSMPVSADLDLNHKYGDADLETFTGNVSVAHKYGDLKIDEVSGKLRMDLSYGNAFVAKANDVDADIGYFKLRINEARTFRIDSKYSQIHVEKASELYASSSYDGYHLGKIGRIENVGKYDNIEVEEVDFFTIETKYTKIDIEHLGRSIKAHLSYGGLEVAALGANFESVQIDSRYTGLEIVTDQVESYRVDVDGRYTSIEIPGNIQTSKDIREDNRTYLVGYRGQSDAAASIKVQAEYGGLKIR